MNGETSLPYFLLFVRSNEDAVIVTSDVCLTCYETKSGDKILRKWGITEEEARKLRDVGTKGYSRVKCVCPLEPDLT